MIDTDKFPVLYLTASLFLTGFVVYSFIKIIYFYFKTRVNDSVHLILFGAASALYICSNSAALVYCTLAEPGSGIRMLITVRELAPLMLIVGLPYMTDQILVLKERLREFNRYLLFFGLAFIAVVTAVTIYDNSLLTGKYTPAITADCSREMDIHEYTILYTLSRIVIIFYFVYSLSLFLYARTKNTVRYPVKKIILSLSILAYVIIVSFFFQLFFEARLSSGFHFPFVSAGFALFLLLNSFALIDNLIDYSRRLLKIESELKQVLYLDRGTGLSNRNGFINDLNTELLRDGNLTLIFIDVDNFQNINESFGEKSGNEILKHLAARLLELFSSDGRLYRIGGDDFVLFHNTLLTNDEAGELSQRIISSLRKPFSVFAAAYTITASIGIVQVPRDGKTTEEIINNAYSAIRNAKQTKNTYRHFSAELARTTTGKIDLVNMLRKSIDMDQFAMYYQPVVDSEKRIVYAESLLRCTNPDSSIGGPGEFIPLLEKAGLMKDIDNMVVRKTFHDMERHLKKKLGISINLSTNQLTDSSYSRFLSSFALQHGIDPELITLEITENSLIENLAEGRDSILSLKNAGFKIAIDDFGKGFSSLSYLSELPVDILKLDMAFTLAVPGDKKRESIAMHIMQLAHSLGLKVVTEGFENSEQFEFFRKIGCDNFQGYYFSKPVPLDDLIQKYLL